MPTTYPPAQPTITGDELTINRFLRNPALVARRLRTLLEQRFISDALLPGRYTVVGGSILVESGESIYSDREIKAVTPLGEYPLTTIGGGTASLYKTQKWGEDTLVSDEAISRLLMNPVNTAFTKMTNRIVRTVDGLALAVIASRVTAASDAAAPWETATARQIFLDVAKAKANILGLNEGFDADTVVVSDLAWTYAMAAFLDAGYLPRESASNPATTGEFPVIDGMRWLSSPNLPTPGTALVLDSTQLGGMADEDLGGPGYVSAGGVGVQAKTIRDEETDGHRLRCRRVTVPVVTEPSAARVITGLAA